jgi:hypothetical protein
VLDDGTQLPSEKVFTDVEFGPSTDNEDGGWTFEGIIVWAPGALFRGIVKSKFRMVFAKDFESITGGEVKHFKPLGTDTPSSIEKFDSELKYSRYVQASLRVELKAGSQVQIIEGAYKNELAICCEENDGQWEVMLLDSSLNVLEQRENLQRVEIESDLCQEYGIRPERSFYVKNGIPYGIRVTILVMVIDCFFLDLNTIQTLLVTENYRFAAVMIYIVSASFFLQFFCRSNSRCRAQLRLWNTEVDRAGDRRKGIQ